MSPIRSITIASLLMLAGCTVSPGYHYTVQIDPSFSSSEQLAIKQAVQSWNAMIGEKIIEAPTVGYCASSDNSICIHKSSLAYIVQNYDAPGDGMALTYRSYTDDSSNIYVAQDRVESDELSPMQIQQLIAHEIGHALGLYHTQTGTLMCAYLQCASLAPTCDDLAQFNSVRGKPEPKDCSFTLSGQ